MRQHLNPIDGLRAVSVILVMLQHWQPAPWLAHTAEHGRIGLLMFFVISGYLITSILLDLREKIDAGLFARRRALFVFYVRRSLRIFPIYYLAVAFACVFVASVREDALYHLLFLQNFSSIWRAPGAYVWAAPLWSLAVEEQFYVFWSLAVLLLPKRIIYLLPVVAILAAHAFKTVVVLQDGSGWLLRASTLGNIDSLSIGTLVAFAHRVEFITEAWLGTARRLSIAIGPVLFLSVHGVLFLGGVQAARADLVYGIFSDLSVLVLLWLLIDNARCARWPRVNDLLNQPFLRYLGKISYGAYVFHQFAAGGVRWLVHKFTGVLWTQPNGGWLVFFCYAAATFLVAHVSWKFFEKPINDFKDKLAPLPA